MECRLAGERVTAYLRGPAAIARWRPAVAEARGILAERGPAAAVLWLRARAAALSRLRPGRARRGPDVEQARRARSRWGGARASHRDPALLWPAGSPPSRAWVAKLPLHRGAAPCVHGGRLDLAICLASVRAGAAVGDLVLCISASFPERPPVYVRAVASHGSRALWRCIAVFRVTSVLPPAAFYGDPAFRARPSCIYALLPAGAWVGLPGAGGRRFALRPRARWHTTADLGARAPRQL